MTKYQWIGRKIRFVHKPIAARGAQVLWKRPDAATVNCGQTRYFAFEKAEARDDLKCLDCGYNICSCERRLIAEGWSRTLYQTPFRLEDGAVVNGVREVYRHPSGALVWRDTPQPSVWRWGHPRGGAPIECHTPDTSRRRAMERALLRVAGIARR